MGDGQGQRVKEMGTEMTVGAAWQELALPLTCPVEGCPWQLPDVQDLPAANPLDWRALPPVVAALLTHLADEAAYVRAVLSRLSPDEQQEGRAALAAIAGRQREVYAAARQLRAAAQIRLARAEAAAHFAALKALPLSRPRRPRKEATA